MPTDEKISKECAAARDAFMNTNAVRGNINSGADAARIAWGFAEGWARAVEAMVAAVGDPTVKPLDDGLFAQPAPEIDPGDLFYKAQVEAAGGARASDGVELREGQWYRRRDGEIVGPAVRTFFPFTLSVQGKLYEKLHRGRASTLFTEKVSGTHPLDLVAYADAPEAGR